MLEIKRTCLNEHYNITALYQYLGPFLKIRGGAMTPSLENHDYFSHVQGGEITNLTTVKCTGRADMLRTPAETNSSSHGNQNYLDSKSLVSTSQKICNNSALGAPPPRPKKSSF